MKLIYAGQGESAKNFDELLFNCTRNKACQRPFFVPVNNFLDILFYAELPGIPSLVDIEVFNVCDLGGELGSAVSTSYIMGDKIDETQFFGVFGGLVVTPPVGTVYSKFFFKFTFTVDGIDHVYWSEMFEFEVCEELVLIKGCYPFETNSEAVDCNGIYYGSTFTTTVGDITVRYEHKAFVRMGSIIEQRNKMTFTAFNNKRIFKNVFVREYLFEFEIVPTFYKDVLIGIFNRGNVLINGVEWKLAESQDFSIIDNDSKLWRMDVVLDSECKQTFGCSVPDCIPPPPPGECVPVAYDVDEPTLPPGMVGVPYVYSFGVVGTAPIGIFVNFAPAWMSISVVGNVVHFSGTPTTSGEPGVDFDLTNCDGEGELNFNSTVVINPCEVLGTIYNGAEITQNILTMTVDGIGVTYVSGTNFPIGNSNTGTFKTLQTGIVNIVVSSNTPISSMTFIDTNGISHSPDSGGGASYGWTNMNMNCGGVPWQIVAAT